jgi:hypothetical protein
MPSWLTPFLGAEVQTRNGGILLQSTYTAAAKPREVVDHYRKLFASAGLPFRPDAMGYGFMIRGMAEECDLTITIRNQGESSAVRITCAGITPEQRERTNRVQKDAEDFSQRSLQAMEKYDRPVYPQPKAPRPAPSWPPWLVHVQGTRLQIQIVPLGEMCYLKSVYTSRLARTDILSFYADLLTANGYQVRSQNASFPSRAWLEADCYPDGRPGRGMVIRAELKPAGGATSVELRVTEFP